MKTSVQKLADQIAADPSASYFLKEAVKKSLQRDPLDALRDAETLVAILADNAAMPSAGSTGPHAAYLAAYERAKKALQAVENFIHDLPAPEGDVEIGYGHVGDMNHIAEQLEEITSNS